MHGSISYQNALWESGVWRSLGAIEKDVLLYLILRTENGLWYASMERLAADTGATTRSCYRLLAALIRRGFAVREQPWIGRYKGRSSPARYRLLLTPAISKTPGESSFSAAPTVTPGSQSRRERSHRGVDTAVKQGGGIPYKANRGKCIRGSSKKGQQLPAAALKEPQNKLQSVYSTDVLRRRLEGHGATPPTIAKILASASSAAHLRDCLDTADAIAARPLKPGSKSFNVIGFVRKYAAEDEIDLAHEVKESRQREKAAELRKQQMAEAKKTVAADQQLVLARADALIQWRKLSADQQREMVAATDAKLALPGESADAPRRRRFRKQMLEDRPNQYVLDELARRTKGETN